MPCSPIFQSVPVKTDFYGTTDIHRNFTTQTTTDADGVLRNTFRGRTLLGVNVAVPSAYTLTAATLEHSASCSRVSCGSAGAGAALASTRPAPRIDDNSGVVCADTIVATSVCGASFVLWEHDRRPEGSTQLLDCIELAEAVHGPLA